MKCQLLVTTVIQLLVTTVMLSATSLASAEYHLTAFTITHDPYPWAENSFLAIDHEFSGVASNVEETPLFSHSYSTSQTATGHDITLELNTITGASFKTMEIGDFAQTDLATQQFFTPTAFQFDFGNRIAHSVSDGPGDVNGLDVPGDNWTSAGLAEVTYSFADGSSQTAEFYLEPENHNGEWYLYFAIMLDGAYGDATGFAISHSVVPEPTTLSLLVMSLLLVGRNRHR